MAAVVGLIPLSARAEALVRDVALPLTATDRLALTISSLFDGGCPDADDTPFADADRRGPTHPRSNNRSGTRPGQRRGCPREGSRSCVDALAAGEAFHEHALSISDRRGGHGGGP